MPTDSKATMSHKVGFGFPKAASTFMFGLTGWSVVILSQKFWDKNTIRFGRQFILFIRNRGMGCMEQTDSCQRGGELRGWVKEEGEGMKWEKAYIYIITQIQTTVW